MRHGYGTCKFLPDFLKRDGNYIGPVYVVGVVTRRIIPGSDDEMAIAAQRFPDWFPFGINKFFEVSWQQMGMQRDLSDDTRKHYMNYFGMCVREP